MKTLIHQPKHTETTPTESIDFISLNESIAANAEKIMDALNIDYTVYPNRVAFACPIHESNRKESLNLFTSGDTSVGNFVCWTNHCEDEVGRGAINLVRSILEKLLNKTVSIPEAVRKVEEITGNKISKIQSTDDDVRAFNHLALKMIRETKQVDYGVTREYVRRNLTIPAKYYINRGFLPETLKEFDIGLCTRKGQQMFMRIVVPIYDITGRYLVGCVGRSINPECSICNMYHAPNRMCPSNKIEEKWAQKWINSEGFKSGEYLYNIWNAAEPARQTQKLVIVEGQGDIWRLYEAGIKNAVGIFGCNFTDTHFNIVESLGVTDIYIALDTDVEGMKARSRVINKLKNYYNLHEINLLAKDVGDMTIEQTQKCFAQLRGSI